MDLKWVSIEPLKEHLITCVFSNANQTFSYKKVWQQYNVLTTFRRYRLSRQNIKAAKSNKAIGDRMNKTMGIVLSERKLSTLDLKPLELYLICKHVARTKERCFERKEEFAQPQLPYLLFNVFANVKKPVKVEA